MEELAEQYEALLSRPVVTVGSLLAELHVRTDELKRMRRQVSTLTHNVEQIKKMQQIIFGNQVRTFRNVQSTIK
ncbi:hypothetical protein SS50377_20694 [Spironucleus salmonicida]|uniref:Uncharacterized protein n=1 Tax=Spironucleus salmonicida TaxID=348837 RepID=V6LZ38_9EUKA|nr:hypothetical protein SS50377_20694 [Spironucleus salmonicida]|eukprot:EST49543.1 Hypothetical protein SS50377_10147 [Spironucleus salmonicida]